MEKDIQIRWQPSSWQRKAWEDGEVQLRPIGGPVVSLKVSVPTGGSVRIKGFQPIWAPSSIRWPELPGRQTVLLGSRSTWHAVSYQELLIYPLRKLPDGSVEVIENLDVVLNVEKSSIEQTNQRASKGANASRFVNPTQIVAAKENPPRRFSVADAVATTPSIRIEIGKDGIYQLTAKTLSSKGFPVSTVDPRKLHLVTQGVEVPIRISGESDGVFNTSDLIVFFGQAKTGEKLPRFNAGDVTDTNVYYLFGDTTAGKRMTVVDGTPRGVSALKKKLVQTEKAEVNSFFHILTHKKPLGDLWYWAPYYGGAAGQFNLSSTYAFSLPQAAPGTAQVEAAIVGFYDVNHLARIKLNNQAPAGSDTAAWSGPIIFNQSWNFTNLVKGTNSVTLTAPGFSDHADYQIADYFKITYTKRLKAISGYLELTGDPAASDYKASGFSKLPYVLDLSNVDSATDIISPVEIIQGSYSSTGKSITFELQAKSGGRRVAIASAPVEPATMGIVNARNLQDPSLHADFLIITHPDFHPAGADTEWQNYLARRRLEFDVEVVDVADVYENFSYGLFDPAAIKSFITYAETNWSVKPRYVLLVGDGTYDYKDYFNRKSTEPTYKNWVPTMMFEDLEDSTFLGRYSSDSWFADVNDDGYPDAAVGRIPVRSNSAFAGVLAKQRIYESQSLVGTWYKSALYVGDSHRAEWERQAFEVFNDSLADNYTTSPWLNQKLYFSSSPFNGVDNEAFAAQLRSAIPSSMLFHYAGHGNIDTWGHDAPIFSAAKVRNGATVSDVDLLAPSYNEPFVLVSNCATSAFDYALSIALMEDLYVRPDRGSIGSLGNSSIAFIDEEETVTTAFYEDAFGLPKNRRLGDLAEVSRFALPSTYSRGVFSLILLGDPTLRLRIPAPVAPEPVNIIEGDGVLSLTWSVTNDAAGGYLVYRSLDGVDWTKLTSEPLSPTDTTYDDTTVANGQLYWYYISSLDIEGFEGPASTWVSGTPHSTIAPAAPTSVTATDAGNGTSVIVGWAANSEPDLAYYTVRYGTAPQTYTNSVVVSKMSNSYVIANLTTGVEIFVVVNATNSSDLTSADSLEASAIPTSPGSPELILSVTRVGADVALNWTKPAGANGYKVYRVMDRYDWDPSSVPYDTSDFVVTISDPNQTSYLDTTVLALPGSASYAVIPY